MKQKSAKQQIALTLGLLALGQGHNNSGAYANPPADAAGHRPNILFIVMDDVGMDQMQIFGYGGATAPRTPNIDAVAHGGVRFRNVWSMPECSPSRAIFSRGVSRFAPTCCRQSSATIWQIPKFHLLR